MVYKSKLGMAFVSFVRAQIVATSVPATKNINFYRDIHMVAGDVFTVTAPGLNSSFTVPVGVSGTLGLSVSGNFQ